MAKLKTIKIERLDASKLKTKRGSFDAKEFIRLARKIKEALRKEEHETYDRFQTA